MNFDRRYFSETSWGPNKNGNQIHHDSGETLDIRYQIM